MNNNFGRTTYFQSIAMLSLSTEPIMAFTDFLNEVTGEFNLEKQTECIDNRIFSDEEMKYLLYIYNRMNRYFELKQREHNEGKIDIWKDWNLQEKEMKEIEKPLPSMKADMDIMRSSPHQ